MPCVIGEFDGLAGERPGFFKRVFGRQKERRQPPDVNVLPAPVLVPPQEQLRAEDSQAEVEGVAQAVSRSEEEGVPGAEEQRQVVTEEEVIHVPEVIFFLSAVGFTLLIVSAALSLNMVDTYFGRRSDNHDRFSFDCNEAEHVSNRYGCICQPSEFLGCHIRSEQAKHCAC